MFRLNWHYHRVRAPPGVPGPAEAQERQPDEASPDSNGADMNESEDEDDED